MFVCILPTLFYSFCCIGPTNKAYATYKQCHIKIHIYNSAAHPINGIGQSNFNMQMINHQVVTHLQLHFIPLGIYQDNNYDNVLQDNIQQHPVHTHAQLNNNNARAIKIVINASNLFGSEYIIFSIVNKLPPTHITIVIIFNIFPNKC